MPYVQQVLTPDPLYLQPSSYSAQSDRKPFADFLTAGVVDIAHFATSVVTGMQLQISAGAAWIAGQNIADQGLYRQYVSTNTQLTVTAAHASLPRLDQVILRILDNAADASGVNEGRIEIVPGTPTSGATLDNRSGAASLTALTEASKSVLLLSDALIPAGATSLTSGNLRDKRTLATLKGSGALPIGALIDYAGTSDPSTHVVIADGRAISRTLYAAAFAVIGTAYGAGDGSTTFNLPDARGKTAIGASGTHPLGSTGGVESVALAVGEMPSHNHGGATLGNTASTDTQGSHAHGLSEEYAPIERGTTGIVMPSISHVGPSGTYNTGASMTAAGAHAHTVLSHAHTISAQGSGTAHNNMQPFVVINKAIRIR